MFYLRLVIICLVTFRLILNSLSLIADNTADIEGMSFHWSWIDETRKTTVLIALVPSNENAKIILKFLNSN